MPGIRGGGLVELRRFCGICRRIERERERRGQAPGQAPGWFTTAPVPAARELLKWIGWSVEDMMNHNGGAGALGHTTRASDACVIVTLLHALEARGLQRGMTAIRIRGDVGTAIAMELT